MRVFVSGRGQGSELADHGSACIYMRGVAWTPECQFVTICRGVHRFPAVDASVVYFGDAILKINLDCSIHF